MNEPLADIAQRILAGGGAARVRAAARLMTVLERDPRQIAALASFLPGHATRPSRVLGVTGPAGAGKSTLVDALIAVLRAKRPDWTLGIVAVDPSSPFTGGAVLGDRIRMMRHASDEKVFIRSLATRGQLGGVSAGVPGVLAALALYGGDLAIIETVGVGQSEVEIARVADRVCVVVSPGQGDSVQWLKAGLMEIGDLFVVNKADRDGADALARQIASAIARSGAIGPLPGATLVHRRSSPPEVLLASATEGRGIEEIAAWLLAAWPIDLPAAPSTP